MKTLNKTSRLFYFFFLIATILVSSCRKEEKSSSKTPLTSTPAKSVKAFADVALPATGLIAYWPLNNSGLDVSGDQLNGLLTNVSSTSDRFSNAVGAYHFDGSTSNIEVPDNPVLALHHTDFTLNAWIKLDSYTTTSGMIIYAKRNPTLTNGYNFSVTGSNMGGTAGELAFGPGGGISVTTTAVMSLSAWHMVSAVYTYSPSGAPTDTTGTLQLYIDGVLKTTATNVVSPNPPTGHNFYIGRDDPANTNNYFFHGSMSNLYIFNSAVSSSTITALYNNTTSTTLLGYWPFDDSGNDLSGNNNNGQINNVTSATDRFSNTVGAYHFDGTTSYVYVPDNTALRLNNTDFTLNAWIKLDAYNSGVGSGVMNKSTASGSGWLFAVAGATSGAQGYIDYSLGYGGGSAVGGPAVSLNAWHMITTVYTKATSTAQIYIDGALSMTQTGLSSPTSTSTAGLYIGRNDPSLPAGDFFEGALDGVGIYNSALSLSSIQQLYTATH